MRAHPPRSAVSTDAKHWRRFISSAPPIDELVEIKRLHDNKTILRRRGDLPASFTMSGAEWRPAR